ncbi:hypothetical protein GCM10007979_33980 [Nocardioides albus]|nr:hypothetical protein GCM10007979_33980 [Nocardioides albus]
MRGSRCAIARSNVDLPAPFSPTSAIRSPGETVRSIPESTEPLRKETERSRTTIGPETMEDDMRALAFGFEDDPPGMCLGRGSEVSARSS